MSAHDRTPEAPPSARESFMADVARELDRAYAEHGRKPWGRHEFYGIIYEEFDELWDDIKADAPEEQFYAEMVQVAAMCFRHAETRRGNKTADAISATSSAGPAPGRIESAEGSAAGRVGLREFLERVGGFGTPEATQRFVDANLDDAVTDFRELDRPGCKCPARPFAVVPTDCNYPFCGCDPKTDRVIGVLQECGALMPDEARTARSEGFREGIEAAVHEAATIRVALSGEQVGERRELIERIRALRADTTTGEGM